MRSLSNVNTEVEAAIVEHLKAGRRLEAIRVYREATGADLARAVGALMTVQERLDSELETTDFTVWFTKWRLSFFAVPADVELPAGLIKVSNQDGETREFEGSALFKYGVTPARAGELIGPELARPIPPPPA
jgi:hypothetical protein